MRERSTRLLLAASLALNVFAAGGAAGGAYVWYRSERPAVAAARGGAALRFAAADLSPERRAAFREALAAARRAGAGDAAAARGKRDELRGLLAADPLDRAAIDAALAAIRQADGAVRARVEAAVVDYAAALGPADRATLLDGLENRGQMLRRGPRGRAPGDGSPPPAR